MSVETGRFAWFGRAQGAFGVLVPDALMLDLLDWPENDGSRSVRRVELEVFAVFSQVGDFRTASNLMKNYENRSILANGAPPASRGAARGPRRGRGGGIRWPGAAAARAEAPERGSVAACARSRLPIPPPRCCVWSPLQFFAFCRLLLWRHFARRPLKVKAAPLKEGRRSREGSKVFLVGNARGAGEPRGLPPDDRRACRR